MYACMYVYIIFSMHGAGEIHSCDPKFNVLCGIEGCIRTYKNYASFRKHIKTHNIIEQERDQDNETADEQCSVAQLDSSESDLVQNDNENSNHNDIFQHALFILKLKELHKVTQVAISDIISDVSLIIECQTTKIRKKALAAMDSEASDHESFKKAFEIDNPFNHLSTEYLQTKYFHEHMGLVVSSKLLLIVPTQIITMTDVHMHAGAQGNSSCQAI